MRQISPDKKRTYVYSKTQGRLKPNARAFKSKRKDILNETSLRFFMPYFITRKYSGLRGFAGADSPSG